MKNGRLFVLIFVGLGLVLVWVGCAKPPDAEKQAAKGAMDAAISAGAEKYAAPDLDAAKRVWDMAESQMNQKKYKEAKQGYMDAKAAFEKAMGAVEAGKKAASDQASGVLASIEESWKKLEATAQTMAKHMKDKKEAWMADSTAFTDGLAKAKEMIAADPAGAKPKLDELKAMVDKWDNIFKEMAAAAAKPPKAKKATTKKAKK